MNGNYPYSGEEAYVSEGFSLKPDLIKSPVIKQLQRLTLQQLPCRKIHIFGGEETNEKFGLHCLFKSKPLGPYFGTSVVKYKVSFRIFERPVSWLIHLFEFFAWPFSYCLDLSGNQCRLAW